MEAARVTILGKGHAHLEARALVLKHFWEVEMVALDEGGTLSKPTDLLIVCHSLPEMERQGWVESVRQASPSLLIVKMNGYDAGPHLGADATVDESNGPGALVSTIYELLTERGLPSRLWPPDDSQAWVQ